MKVEACDYCKKILLDEKEKYYLHEKDYKCGYIDKKYRECKTFFDKVVLFEALWIIDMNTSLFDIPPYHIFCSQEHKDKFAFERFGLRRKNGRI